MIHTEKDSKDPRVKKYDPDYTWTKEKEDERMNIPEDILSRLTEEQKNRRTELETQKPRRNYWPSPRKPAMSFPGKS